MAIKYSSLATLRAFKEEVDARYLKKADYKTPVLVKLDTASEGAFASYKLQVDGVDVANSATIDVAKDYVLRSAAMKTVADGDTFGDDFAVGDKYIELVVNAKDATLGTDDTVLRINVKDLFNEYTAGDAIDVTNGVVSVKVKSGSALTIDGTTGELDIPVVSATDAGVVTPEMMAKWNNAADAQLVVGTPTGSGNAVTSLSVNASGELVAEKGITALTADDLEEIDDATGKALWDGTSPTPPTPTPTKHTVRFFDAAGNTELFEAQEVEDGNLATDPGTPDNVPDGFVGFAGWKTPNDDTGVIWDFANDRVNGALDLYASWTTT